MNEGGDWCLIYSTDKAHHSPPKNMLPNIDTWFRDKKAITRIRLYSVLNIQVENYSVLFCFISDSTNMALEPIKLTIRFDTFI